MKLALKVLGAALLVFAAVAIYQSSKPEFKEQMLRKDAIELCWQEQGRKSLTPAAGRTMAGTCEYMEAEYRKQYGVDP